MHKRKTGAGGGPARKHTLRRRVLAWDRIVLRAWQRISLSPAVHRALTAFVRMGDGWGWLALAALLAALLPLSSFLYIAGQGILAAAISLPLYRGLKAMFRRTRPHSLFRSVTARVAPRDAYSFPSGHTMNNLAIGVSLAVHLPALWIFAIAVPVLTGLLRVMYGVHFISDIVAGAFFGFLAGFAAVALYSVLLPG